MKPNAIIIDLDGTLALIDRDPYKTELCMDDKLNHAVAKVIDRFYPDYKIILVTGREEHHRELTIAWLTLYKIDYEELIMRPDGNRNITGVDYKKTVYNEYLFPKYEVLFAMEDMFKVAEMYREQGLPCFQVAKDRFLK